MISNFHFFASPLTHLLISALNLHLHPHNHKNMKHETFINPFENRKHVEHSQKIHLIFLWS
jgi:hypothetical protein